MIRRPDTDAIRTADLVAQLRDDVAAARADADRWHAEVEQLRDALVVAGEALGWLIGFYEGTTRQKAPPFFGQAVTKILAAVLDQEAPGA